MNDAQDEENETFTINVTSPDGSALTSTHVVTIVDEDGPPSLSLDIAPSSVAEGGSVTAKAILNPASGKQVEVGYRTESSAGTGVAQAGADYVVAAGILTFAPGETEKTFAISVIDDTLNELAETFSVVLLNDSDLKNATLGANARRSVTIASDASDSEPTATLAVAPIEVDEGGERNAVTGKVEVTATATLSEISGRQVNLGYRTGDAGDTATPEMDYVTANGTLVFAPGELEKTFPIEILTDQHAENDETFTVVLEAHQNGGATLGAVTEQTVTIRANGPDPVLGAISEHLQSRGQSLLENLPDLIGITRESLDADGTDAPSRETNFALNVTSSGAHALGGFRNGGLWGEAKFSRAETSGTRGDHILAALGAHSQVSERLFLGGLLLFDSTETELTGDTSGNINGYGWMAGPYFAARYSAYPLYFEGRLLYGRTTNEIESFLSSRGDPPRDGSFDSHRWLVQGRIEGEYPIGIETKLIPIADFSHIHEEGEEFVDSLGDSIPGQMANASKLQLGAKFSIPFETEHGALVLRPGLRYVLTDENAPHSKNSDTGLDHHARFDFGVDYKLEERTSISFNGYYSGLGRSDFELYGASINLLMQF